MPLDPSHPLYGAPEDPWLEPFLYSKPSKDRICDVLAETISSDPEVRRHARVTCNRNGIYGKGMTHLPFLRMIPILLRLAEWPETPEPEWVFECLGYFISWGYDFYLYPGFDPRVEFYGGDPTATPGASNDRIHCQRPPYLLLFPYAPRIAEFIDSVNTEVASAAAFVASWYPDTAPKAVPAIRALIARSSGRRRLDAIISLGFLAREESGLEPMLESPCRDDRIAAALGLALGGVFCGAPHLDILFDASLGPGRTDLKESRWSCWGPSTCIARGDWGGDDLVLDRLVAASRTAADSRTLDSLAYLGLSIVQPSASEAGMTRVQPPPSRNGRIGFLEWLVEHGQWEDSGFTAELARCKLPDTREGLARHVDELRSAPPDSRDGDGA